jgi:hypothetical protein
VLEKYLDELKSIQVEDEVKNVLVTLIKLVINFRDAKSMVRHLWKTIYFHEQHYNKIERNQLIKFVQWDCRRIRRKLPEIQQRSQNIHLIILPETWLDEAENASLTW